MSYSLLRRPSTLVYVLNSAAFILCLCGGVKWCRERGVGHAMESRTREGELEAFPVGGLAPSRPAFLLGALNVGFVSSLTSQAQLY